MMPRIDLGRMTIVAFGAAAIMLVVMRVWGDAYVAGFAHGRFQIPLLRWGVALATPILPFGVAVLLAWLFGVLNRFEARLVGALGAGGVVSWVTGSPAGAAGVAVVCALIALGSERSKQDR